MNGFAGKKKQSGIFYLLIFIFLAAIILTAGFLFYKSNAFSFRSEAERPLDAIVELKVSELLNWRRGRLNDARLFFQNGVFAELVKRYFAEPADADARDQIRTWLSHFQVARQYERIMVLDSALIKKMIIPEGKERPVSYISMTSLAELRSGKVVLEDLYWNEENQKIYLKIMVPIFHRPEGHDLLAVLAMRIDPNDYLYPLIQRWPTPSRTAETLLVRRDGDDVLYLNELRFLKKTAMKLRIPLSSTDVSAVQAVLGKKGIVEGRDYRGVPVLAVLHAIPGSPWYLVARIDKAEVFAPLEDRLRLIIILVAVLLLGGGAGLALMRKRQQVHFLKEQAEKAFALRESEERSRIIIHSIQFGIVIIDAHTHIILDANSKALEMIGESIDAIVGSLCHFFICPAELGKCPVTDLGQPVNSSERVLLTTRGEKIPILKSVIKTMLGGREVLIESFIDISERKQIESQKEVALSGLRESEERFRALSASAQDAILMMDDQGRLTFWNKAAERIFGYRESEALGGNLHDLIAPKRYHPAHHAAFPEFVRTGQGAAVGQTLELQGLCKDGREITVALSLSAVQITGDWHAVGILRDISEQKEAEKEMHDLLGKLQLANNQLEAATLQANQLTIEAQAANIAKSQFLANMSHEIRTPMNGVMGMIGLLLGTELSGEQRRYAETVRLSGEALLAVINDILDFSKIEADKLELESIDFDLRAMIEHAAELLAVRAHEKNLEFVCRVDPEVQTFLRGDPGRLRQVLINLGSNAVKFTARGEVFIEVKLDSESEDKVKIRVEVRDTGIGIPADKIDLLFSAFQQVDASTTRRFGGTGLGLAISKRLVQAMGGHIGIESREGQGSTFWFTAVLDKQPLGDRKIRPGQGEIRGIRILVVDDNATNRLILGEQLASWNTRHDEAESAGQALTMLRAARALGDPFRIVISDMQMPEMDGESLGRAIKADAGISDTILVMMTSLGRRGDAKQLKAIGFSAYLTKPVKQSQLYDCLATVIGVAVSEAAAQDAVLVTRHTISEARRLKVRILLVEDNPTNQQVALGILGKMGFRVDAVNDGSEAIRALETVAYDLVFMDVQMPVMDGFEATAAIRSGRTAVPDPRIPIIAMTAHAMKGDRERCLAAGMDDYIPKPLAPQAVAAVLEKWLDHARKNQSPVPVVRSGTPIFDRRAFVERLMGDLDLAREIGAGFLEDMPRQLDKLKECIAAGDAGKAGGQAHAIKGAAANVGGLAFSAAALVMEQAAGAGRLEEVKTLLPELERQFRLLQEKLQERQDEDSAG